jgi:hypothetical protein
VVTWVPFNESWGVPDLPSHPPQQEFVLALYHLTRALDPTRPVVGNDGWESAATDIFGIHDYDQDAERLHHRYGVDDVLAVLNRLRPGGRRPTLEGHEHAGQPIVLTEFGGIAYTPPGQRDGVWGYSVVETAEELGETYEALLRTVHDLPLLAGFCYTQFADTYREINGLLYADRTPKFPLERMEAVTRGLDTRIGGKTYGGDGHDASEQAALLLASRLTT